MPMNYETFKKELIQQLEMRYSEDEYKIHIRSVIKNNGLHLDGLCIFKAGKHISPTIYLNDYYDRYLQGSNLAELLDTLICEYESGLKMAPEIDVINSYYEAVQSQIVMRLVNYEKNKEILEECPYIPFFDLAITFRWLAHWDEIGISTALITNAEMQRWEISLEQLYADAMANTQRIFPADICGLKDLLQDQDDLIFNQQIELFVLTNSQGVNGATSILYQDLLKEFAAERQTNLYLLPSSIHEILICPEQEDVSVNMLLSLVREANHVVVTMGEVLSDNIYYYDYKKDQIRFIENSDSRS